MTLRKPRKSVFASCTKPPNTKDPAKASSFEEKNDNNNNGHYFRPPPSGITAECGRRVRMEDNYQIYLCLVDTCEIPFDLKPIFPYGMDSETKHALSQSPFHDSSTRLQRSQREVLHFYAVYDGHGGPEAAKHCQMRMHEHIRDAWNNLSSRDGGVRSVSPFANGPLGGHRMPHNGLTTSDSIQEVFQRAFKATDEEYPQIDGSPLIGTTAVVTLVGLRSIFVAYCGDSRAVIRRNGVAHQLTVDHKPERDDEIERIKGKGGQVLYFNGARVMGLLAMSRAIGDVSLKPYVTHEPDACIFQRSIQDEVLILATDGLWDVVDHQEACDIAVRCLKRAREKGASASESARLASAVLARAASTRGSRDNITVLVVDLSVSDDEFATTVSSSENDAVYD
eukprot:g1188.t1